MATQNKVTSSILDLKTCDAEEIGKMLGLTFWKIISNSLEKGKEYAQLVYSSELFCEILTIYQSGRMVYQIGDPEVMSNFETFTTKGFESTDMNLVPVKKFLLNNDYKLCA